MKTINRSQLQKKRGGIDELTLINTLPADKFDETRIEGSINIPQEKPDFVERVKATVNDNFDSEIVVYCASADCNSSTQAAEKLDEAGFTQVFDYEGGAKDWKQSQQTASR